MILATEWFMRKRDIAVPERMDLFPISRGPNPKVSALPK
jgi:hypothetical protein